MMSHEGTTYALAQNIKPAKANRFLRCTILLGIISVLFMSIFEVIALIQGTLTSQNSALTPWYFKGIKDLCFLVIVVYAITPLILGGKILKKTAICTGLWFAGILPSFLFSVPMVPVPILVSGFRWALPMLLPAFLFHKLEISFMVKLTNVLIFLFLVHFLSQIYQLFFMGHWFGLNQWGFPTRLPGIFLIPNTAAFFNLLVLFFISKFKSKIIAMSMFVLIFLSTFSTASGTGIILLLIYAFFTLASKIAIMRKNMRLVMFLGVPFLIAIGLMSINLILPARGSGYVIISLGSRLSILFDAFSSGIFSASMGLATNAGVIFSNLLPTSSKAIISDSLFASILINLGYWGLMFFGILAFIYFKPFFQKKAIKELNFYTLFLILIVLFSFTTITFEVFPVNLLISIMIAYAHAPK